MDVVLPRVPMTWPLCCHVAMCAPTILTTKLPMTYSSHSHADGLPAPKWPSLPWAMHCTSYHQSRKGETVTSLP
ncbi:hypothetical protein B484DRAFT_41078 [Ochromonadaceae sp. CCMP2298]|nr:hypothetical protein B484DRAFT_41078 [Ochromonadaceae sp. CCMP2298]